MRRREMCALPNRRLNGPAAVKPTRGSEKYCLSSPNSNSGVGSSITLICIRHLTLRILRFLGVCKLCFKPCEIFVFVLLPLRTYLEINDRWQRQFTAQEQTAYCHMQIISEL